MDECNLRYMGMDDYLWFSWKTMTAKLVNYRYEVTLAAFIRTYREKLLADDIWIYSTEAAPLQARSVWEGTRNETAEESSVYYQWVRHYLDYEQISRENPLKFADEHEDLAVPFLKAMLKEGERYLAATDVEAYRRRIAEIEAKPGYVPCVLPKDFWDFRKAAGVTEEVAAEKSDELCESTSPQCTVSCFEKQKRSRLSDTQEKAAKKFIDELIINFYEKGKVVTVEDCIAYLNKKQIPVTENHFRKGRPLGDHFRKVFEIVYSKDNDGFKKYKDAIGKKMEDVGMHSVRKRKRKSRKRQP